MTHYTAYNPEHLGARVFLNGIEVRHVFECDDAEGWLVRACVDEKGRYQLSGDGRGVRQERREGLVTVELPAR